LNDAEPDGTSGILRINQNGKVANPGILGNKFPLNMYYAYGMWNSFGIDFDPVTGKPGFTFHKTQGTIFRIVSKATNATTTD